MGRFQVHFSFHSKPFRKRRLFNLDIMRDFYISADPGKKGFCCILSTKFNDFNHYPLFDGQRLNPKLIKHIKCLVNQNVMAIVEQVHSMPHDGISRSFSFGMSYGKILGMLESLGIPYVTCTPGKWQKEMWEAVDKAANTKLTSYNAARRLLPNMDFRRSERCKTFDDNKVDATLLCLYAQRKQL